MRRLRAGTDVPPLPGGPESRPRGIMTPPLGARWTGNGPMVVGPPKRIPAHKGVTSRPAGPAHNQEARQPRACVAGESPRREPQISPDGASCPGGAPRGARASQEARLDGTTNALIGAPSPRFGRGK